MNKYGEIAHALDQMRLNLDAYTEDKNDNWRAVEAVWWRLQTASQDFWISTKVA